MYTRANTQTHTHTHRLIPSVSHPQLTLMPEQTVLPLVDKSNEQDTTHGVSFQHPEIIANADLVTQRLSEPYYWRLPKQFQGSMVSVGKKPTAISFTDSMPSTTTTYSIDTPTELELGCVQ